MVTHPPITESTTTADPAAGTLLASDPADAVAADAVRRHHAELAGALAARTDALVAAAATGPDDVAAAQQAVVSFCTEQLLPHAAAEEEALYPAAARHGRAALLVEAMVAEHGVLKGLVEQVRTSTSPVGAAAAAHALRVLFESHLGKENDLVLPLVAADPGTSLAGLLEGMHALLGGEHDASPVREAREPGAPDDERGPDARPARPTRTAPSAV